MFESIEKIVQMRLLKLFYAICFSVYVLFNAVSHPANNWDMIGYVASVVSSNGFEGEELRKRTYDDVKSYVPAPVYEVMTSGDYYREVVYSDPESLSQQLPFYKIRYLYIKFISLLSTFTESISQATVYTSALFAFLISMTTAWYFSKLGSFYYIYPFLLLPIGLLPIATLSTPDTMATFFAFLSVMLYKNKRVLSLLILAVLPLIRTDFIILVFLLLLVRFYQGGRRQEYIFFAMAFFAYFITNTMADNYGHLMIFNFTLIPNELRPYPEEMVMSHAVKDYLRAYMAGGYSLIVRGEFFIAIASFSLVVKDFASKDVRYSTLISLVGLLFLFIHFLAFPAAFQRTYLASNLIMLYFLAYRFYFQGDLSLKDSGKFLSS
nr:hypothetical protein [uncultured Halomonas sp.]